MLKKLWQDQQKRRSLMFVVMTFVFTITLFLGGTSRGFISTFPIFFISAIPVFVFYRDLKTSVIMTAVLSLALSLADEGGYNSVAEQNPTLNLAFIKTLFFIISVAAAYCVAGWVKTKSKSGYIKSVLLIAVYLWCFNLIFGNIFGAVTHQNQTSLYLKENYPSQQIESMSTAFNFKSHEYETVITFNEPDSSYYGEEKIILEKASDGKFLSKYDGYFLYAKQRIFEKAKAIMIQALRDTDQDMVVQIDSLALSGNPTRNIFDLGSDYTRVFPYMSYQITIKDDAPTMEIFQQKCNDFIDAVSHIGMPFDHLLLYGGEKSGLLFQAEFRDNVLTVGEFDKNQYIAISNQ